MALPVPRPLANQHYYSYSQTEGGPPTAKPTLIPRSPHPSAADEERDMNRGNQKRVPPNQPNETGQRTKTVINPRGPHYSGTHSQRSSTSSYSSLSESSSGDSRHNHHSGTVSPPRPQEHPHHSSAQGHYPYQYRNQVDPYEPNLLQYSDGKYVGPMNTRPQQHTTGQYQGRRAYETHSIPPTPAYYAPHENREYGTAMHQQPGASRPPQNSQYRSVSHMPLPHLPLVKSHSEERFRDSYLIESESQRGFSSLGELPDSHNEQPVTTRPPLTTQYMYQYPSGQYGEPTYAPAHYNPPQPSYSHDVTSIHTGPDYNRLSESTEAMRINSDFDEDIEINKQPVDQTADLRERVVFTCEACVVRCKEEPNLLWFKNREPLIGEIDSMYIIEETTERDAGTYHCLVTHPLDAAKQKESYPAQLTIKTQEVPPEPSLAKLPKIVKQPEGRLSAVVGEPLEVSIQASGDEPLTYKWYRNSIALQFAQSAVLRFPVAAITDSGDYCCRVANDHGSILSKVFTLEVTRARAVTSDLSDSYLQRVSVTIAHQVRGIHELARSLGVKMSSLAFYGTLEEQTLHLLRVWRDNKRGTKQQLLGILKQLHITLGDVERSQVFGQPNTGKLAFIQQPQSAKVIYGQSVSLQVAVSNKTSSTRYQWYLNRRQLHGQTAPRLSISSAVESDEGEYLCVVSDKDIRIQSEPAVVDIADPTQPYFRRAPDPAPQTQIYNPAKQYLINRGSSSGNELQSSVPFEPKEQLPTLKDSGIAIVEHPASVEIEPGDPLTLRCKATCKEGELSYSWYFNGLLIKDEEQSEYVLNFFTDEDEGFYKCKVSNKFGSVESNVAQVKAKQDSD